MAMRQVENDCVDGGLLPGDKPFRWEMLSQN